MKWYSKIIFLYMLGLVILLVYSCNVFLWQTLEMYIDGQVHTSNADTIVNIVLTYLLVKNNTKLCLKYIFKPKENEYEKSI